MPTSRSAAIMDAKDDIREFLVSRRERISPQDAGLPAYGTTRRVKGLRREEVALLAGISVEYYTRLERGNARGPSEDVLDGVARALVVGELHLDYEALDLPGDTGQRVLIYSAEPASPSAEALALLASWATTPAATPTGPSTAPE